MNNIEVFINTLAAQARLATKKHTFNIKVKHKVGMELAVEEEGY